MTPAPLCRTCGQAKTKNPVGVGQRWLCPTCQAAAEARHERVIAAQQPAPPATQVYLSSRLTRAERLRQQQERLQREA